MLHWLFEVLVWVAFLRIDIILMQLKDMIGSLHKFFYFHVAFFVHFLRFLLYYVDYRPKLSFIQWLRLSDDPFKYFRVTTCRLPL